MIEYVLLFLGAYLLGAVPFGVLAARAHGIDLSKVGSGNVGATNVSRALGPGWALAIFLLDVAKGVAPSMLAYRLGDPSSQGLSLAAGTASIFGHCASPFLRFKGGKGIATGLGVLFGSSYLDGIAALGVFAVAFGICQYVSLSSILAVGALLVLSFIRREPWGVVTTYSGLYAFILIRHRANIGRLRRGEEPRFSFRPGPKPPPDANKSEPKGGDDPSKESDDAKDSAKGEASGGGVDSKNPSARSRPSST